MSEANGLNEVNAPGSTNQLKEIIMGGNALKTVKTNRITASEYVDASTKLYELLISIGLDATVIPAYRDKESFGDIDVVIATHKMDAATLTHCMDVIAKAMGSKETYRNSNVLSLDWSGESWSTVQVDLIFHDSSYAVTHYLFPFPLFIRPNVYPFDK